jgi:hypothetical protein
VDVLRTGRLAEEEALVRQSSFGRTGISLMERLEAGGCDVEAWMNFSRNWSSQLFPVLLAGVVLQLEVASDADRVMLFGLGGSVGGTVLGGDGEADVLMAVIPDAMQKFP